VATVKFDHVSKVYPNGYSAIKDLCLEIADGEFLVFVGPSGCGKSTALRMLAGLEDISSGQLWIGEQVVNDRTPQQRNIAMVFQNYALYPHMTVRQNLEFPLRMQHLPKGQIQNRVMEAAEKLELAALLSRKPKQLSGGQQQRVAMGRAIVREPSVCLMDEPLSNLDAKMRVQIRTKIAELQRQMNTTTVYVTHDQVEAMTMGDRVAVMRGGKLQQITSPQELYEHPTNIFVAGFIGSPAMNIFQTQVQQTERGAFELAFGERALAIDPQVVTRYPALNRYLNQPILAGLRPEAFHLANTQAAPDACIQIQVNALEALGHEMIVYAEAPVAMIQADESRQDPQLEQSNSAPLIARVPSSHDIHLHSPLTLSVDVSKLYLFTPNGQAMQ
jgi:multiple sugar transport system ATP-binding protein